MAMQIQPCSTRLALLLGGIAAFAGVSCSTQKVLHIHNESDRQLESRRMYKQLSIPPGGTESFALVNSKTTGLSIPLLEARTRTTSRQMSIHLNGINYSLPPAYVESLDDWSDRSWAYQARHPDAGRLVYRSPAEVILTQNNEVWPLREVGSQGSGTGTASR